MKVLVVTLLALVAVVSSKNINFEDVIDLEDITAYDYHNKIGIPLANSIREFEAQDVDVEMESRIAGGSFANLGQFPYQAGLVISMPGGQSVCGAILVNNRRLLTAAHCWFDGRNQASMFTVVLGSLTLFSGGQRLNTNNVAMHASWNPTLIRDDIAMITPNSAVTLNNNVAPIALPAGAELNNNFAGWTATASGFGRTGDGANQGITTGQRLSHVNLPVITNAVCSQSFNIVTAGNVCTSGAGGRSTCGGDSGGPLVVTNNGRRIVIGIVSFGSASGCTRNFPAAFVRVTSFMNWIQARL